MFLTASSLTSSVSDVLSVVGSVLKTVTTTEIAPFFYCGIVGVAIGIVRKLRK